MKDIAMYSFAFATAKTIPRFYVLPTIVVSKLCHRLLISHLCLYTRQNKRTQAFGQLQTPVPALASEDCRQATIPFASHFTRRAAA